MNQLASRTSTSRPSLAPMVGLGVVGVVLLVGAQRLGHLNSDELGALITVSVLLALTIPIAVVLGRLDEDRGLTTLLLAAFVAKMIGAYVRYTVLYDVYQGEGDAGRYYGIGLELADQFRHGSYVFGEVSGTRFIEILSGLAYTILPQSQLAGFVLFAWVAFLGLILFSRAIRIALPDANHRRYDLFLFFLPTLVFWPSSIGKEAWMVAMLGLASYGAARVFTHSLSGVVPLGLGLWGTSVVRPHVALIALAALGPAWLVRPSGRNRFGLSPYLRAFGFAVLIIVLLAVVSQAETFFGIERLDAEGAETLATFNEEQTGQGGSKFESARVDSPADIPVAAITVLFRPFIWEAGNTQGMLTATEGMVLLGLVLVSWRQILKLPKAMMRQPYVLYCIVFTLGFIVAFSSLNNFGILVRQRAQLFPFFLVLLTPLGLSAQSDEVTESPKRRMPRAGATSPYAAKAVTKPGDAQALGPWRASRPG